jgi:hypothetical protein
MTYKVINEEHVVLHDYTMPKARLTHMCVAASEPYPVKFKELETQGVRGTYRTALTIQPGDIIYKTMSGGGIGAWEVQRVTGSKVPAELCEPFRDQSLEMYFMGYLVEGLVEIFRGYGELPEKSPMTYRFWGADVIIFTIAVLVIAFAIGWVILCI